MNFFKWILAIAFLGICHAQEFYIAINCGGKAYKSIEGYTFMADTFFVGGSIKTLRKDSIENTLDDSLYFFQREGGEFKYAIPVPNDEYDVQLRFAEFLKKDPNDKRKFSVYYEDVPKLSQFDLLKFAGIKKAYQVSHTVKVTDGILNLDFYNISENPVVSGILVRKKSNVSNQYIFPENYAVQYLAQKQSLVMHIPNSGKTSLVLYNPSGKRIQVLENQYVQAPILNLNLESFGLRPGIWMYSFTSNSKKIVGKFSVSK